MNRIGIEIGNKVKFKMRKNETHTHTLVLGCQVFSKAHVALCQYGYQSIERT